MKKYNSAWFFYEFEEGREYKAGDIVDIQIMRTGQWDHPQYGQFNISMEDLLQVKDNFDSQKRGVELAVDENHEPNHKALGWFKELVLHSDALFAKVKLTKLGAELLTQGAYRYFSPEIAFEYTDDETGEKLNNLLVGGAFTNRPFFKNMKPLMASEVSGQTTNIYLFNKKSTTMDNFLRVFNDLKDKESISKDEKEAIEKAFNELSEKEQSAEGCKEAMNEVVAKFTDEGGKGEEPKEEVKEEEKPAEEDGEKKEDEKVEESKEEEKEEEVKEEEKQVDEAKSDEESKEEVKEETVKATEEVKTVSYKEYSELKKEVSRLENEARKQQIAARVNGLVFSEKNENGVLLPKEADKTTKVAMALNEKDREVFFDLIEGRAKLSKSIMFKEIGADGVDKEEVDPAEALIKKAEKYAEKNSVDFDVAVKEVAKKNPTLFKAYKAKY